MRVAKGTLLVIMEGKSMLRSVSHLIIVFLMSWIGIGTVRVRPVQNSPQSEMMNSCPQDSIERNLEFKELLSGRGKTEDGASFSFHLYEASDGVAVSTRSEKRGSLTRANKELQRQIKKAIKILERGPKLDKSGKQVGERAVLMIASKGPHKDQAVVLWTNGSQFYYIESSSLRHVLELEKRYIAEE